MYVLRRVAAASILSCVLLGCDDTQQPTNSPASTFLNTTDLTTSVGTLKIAMGENTVADSLFLNGELIFQRVREQLRFYGQQKRAQDEAVLVGSNCGVSCPTDQLVWVVLKPNAKPLILEDRQFYAYPDEIKLLPPEGDKLSIDLGFSQQKRHYADLMGDTLSFRLEPVPEETKVLNEEACSWLHAEVLPACIDARKTEPDCINPQTELPDFIDQRLSRVNDNPGFNSDSFATLCENACKKEEIPVYKTFASLVCGKH